MKMKKSIALVVSLVLVLTVTVGGTLAFLIATSGPVTNIFNPSSVTTSVEETIENDVKTNVKIKNTGDTDAYIRAAVVVTWQNQAGDVYGQMPIEDTDYTITFTKDSGWVLGADGFYYWTSPVAYDPDPNDAVVPENCFTGVLIERCTAGKTLTVGGTTYYLTVEILGSGIQSVPASVVTEEWSSGVSGIDTDGVTLKIKTSATSD